MEVNIKVAELKIF